MKINTKNIPQYRRQMIALALLAKICGVERDINDDFDEAYDWGEEIYHKLKKIEKYASRLNELDCNVGRPEEKVKKTDAKIREQVQGLFNNNLKGFYHNGDPRGYALKLTVEQHNEFRGMGISLHSDFGGYGILAPEYD